MTARHLSPALHGFPPEKLHVVPLTGIEAQIYSSLWRSILEGKLKPGTKLREEVIGEVFGVSRTITRKVLQIMEQEGGVVLLLNRGAYVATPVPDDAAHVFETLGMIMTHVITRLADPSRVIRPEQCALIDQHIAAQAAADADSNFISSQLLATDFLVLLAAINGNPVITELTDRMLMRQALILTLYRQYVLPPERAAFHHFSLSFQRARLKHRAEKARRASRSNGRSFGSAGAEVFVEHAPQFPSSTSRPASLLPGFAQGRPRSAA
jgi:DNA-binding GntR family transcriptional regulator